MAIKLTEGAALIDAARQGSTAAQQVRATLEIFIGPIGATELPTHSLALITRREIEPATGLGGPDFIWHRGHLDAVKQTLSSAHGVPPGG